MHEGGTLVVGRLGEGGLRLPDGGEIDAEPLAGKVGVEGEARLATDRLLGQHLN